MAAAAWGASRCQSGTSSSECEGRCEVCVCKVEGCLCVGSAEGIAAAAWGAMHARPLPRPRTCRRRRIQESLRLEDTHSGRITVDIEWKPYF